LASFRLIEPKDDEEDAETEETPGEAAPSIRSRGRERRSRSE